jgi:hypothetical protein
MLSKCEVSQGGAVLLSLRKHGSHKAEEHKEPQHQAGNWWQEGTTKTKTRQSVRDSR